MNDADSARVMASVARWRRARLRLAQCLVPIAVLGTILCRRWGEPVLLLAVVALQAAAIGAFVAAWRRFGRRPVRVEGGKIRFGDVEPPIVPSSVTSWTFTGSTARLYGEELSWKIQAAPSEGELLCGVLSRVLGRPLSVRPRGSRRARQVAVAVAAGGVALVVTAIASGFMALFPVGLLCTIGGGAAFGALSQKIVGVGAHK